MILLPAASHLCEGAFFCHMAAHSVFNRNVRQDQTHIFLDDVSIAIEVVPTKKWSVIVRNSVYIFLIVCLLFSVSHPTSAMK